MREQDETIGSHRDVIRFESGSEFDWQATEVARVYMEYSCRANDEFDVFDCIVEIA